jgi:hypothetical protein
MQECFDSKRQVCEKTVTTYQDTFNAAVIYDLRLKSITNVLHDTQGINISGKQRQRYA